MLCCLNGFRKLNVSFHLDVATRTFSDHSIAYEENPEMDSTIMLVARRYGHSPNEVADLSNAERAVNVLCQAIADIDNWDE